jgi:hypothetical protein
MGPLEVFNTANQIESIDIINNITNSLYGSTY